MFLLTAIVTAGVGVAPLEAAYENVPEPKTYLGAAGVKQANPVVTYANVPEPKAYLPAGSSRPASTGAANYSNLPQPKMLDYNSVPDANPAKKANQPAAATISQTVSVPTNGNAAESVFVASNNGRSFAGGTARQESNVPGQGSIFLRAEVTE